MNELWTQLEELLRKVDPALPGRLGPGATESDIAACEAVLGVTFPQDFRESLQRHGGDPLIPTGGGQTFTTHGIFQHLEWLQPAAIASEWQTWRDDISSMADDAEALGPVRAQWWNPRWIPITLIYGSTHHHCIDLDPAPGGTVGQIIEMGMKDDQRIVVAGSFREFLEKLVSDIAGGTYSYEDDVLVLDDDALDSRTLGGCSSRYMRA